MYKNRLPLINVLTHVTQESGLTKYTPYYMASHSSQKSAAIAA
ncbi:3985_t:CDS:1, partial [Rhizophagus irregularis]